MLMRAYGMGVFPMSEHRDDPDIFWVDPRLRGVIPLDGFHISRSLARRIRAQPYQVTLNQDFIGVLDGCSDRDDTWISGPIRNLYIALHNRKQAHSIEIWQDDALVGGVYGVTLGAAFFGESMFSRRTDASKLALAYLVCHLNTCGFRLFDTQFLTPHLQSLGAKEITRAAYHRDLSAAIQLDAAFSPRLTVSYEDVLQCKTQTSNRA
jgi:leucyl/phenylalanyl-tRNA--protein transferase